MELEIAEILLPDLEDATIEQVVKTTYVLVDEALASDNLEGLANAYRAMRTIMYAYGHPTATIHNRFLIEARTAIDWIEIYDARLQSDFAKFRKLDSKTRRVIDDTTVIVIDAQTAMLSLHDGLAEYVQKERVVADGQASIAVEVAHLKDLEQESLRSLEEHVALRVSYMTGMAKHRADMKRFTLR